MFSFQTQPAEVDKCLRTQSTTFTYIHLHPHLPMSLTPTFILPYSTLQGCSGAPGPRPAYKHSLSAPIHAHVVPVQYGDTYMGSPKDAKGQQTHAPHNVSQKLNIYTTFASLKDIPCLVPVSYGLYFLVPISQSLWCLVRYQTQFQCLLPPYQLVTCVLYHCHTF